MVTTYTKGAWRDRHPKPTTAPTATPHYAAAAAAVCRCRATPIPPRRAAACHQRCRRGQRRDHGRDNAATVGRCCRCRCCRRRRCCPPSCQRKWRHHLGGRGGRRGWGGCRGCGWGGCGSDTPRPAPAAAPADATPWCRHSASASPTGHLVCSRRCSGERDGEGQQQQRHKRLEGQRQQPGHRLEGQHHQPAAPAVAARGGERDEGEGEEGRGGRGGGGEGRG